MLPVQWLIDLLSDFQGQSPINQLTTLLAIVTPVVSAVLAAFLWMRSRYRRGYERLEKENEEFQTKLATREETIRRLRREVGEYEQTVKKIQSNIPEVQLDLAKQERTEGNEGKAYLIRGFHPTNAGLKGVPLQW